MELTNEEKEVIKFLGKVVNILDGNNVHFWLHAGTLLGYIRSGKKHLHEMDLDIDLLVWEDEFKKVLSCVSELTKEFKIKVLKDKIVIFHGKYDISIGTYRKEGDMAIRYTIAIKNKFGALLYYRLILRMKSRFWIHFLLKIGYYTKSIHPSQKMIKATYFENLKKEDIFGVKINIPKDTMGYIKNKYGDTWKTPYTAEAWENDTQEQHYKKPNNFKKLNWNFPNF